MGLLDFNASLLYTPTKNHWIFETGISYSRFYPVLELQALVDRNRSLHFVDHTENWTRRTATAGFHVPLNLSRGYYSTGLSVGANIESINLRGGGLPPDYLRLGFSRSRQRSLGIWLRYGLKFCDSLTARPRWPSLHR